MGSDLRYAIRALRSGRLFTVVAVACLAAGIATNTAMFSVFDAIFWRPLPFADADRLLTISGRDPKTGRSVAMSLEDAHVLASTTQSIDALAAYRGWTATLTGFGDAERLPAQAVTSALFATLGVRPQRGRRLEAGDDLATAADTAVLSDALWRRRFNADPAVIGRLIRLDNIPYTIVGIMPAGFGFPNRSEVWVGLGPTLARGGAAVPRVSLLGRLAPGASLARANAELAARQLPAVGARAIRMGVARPLRAAGVGSEERTITGALMGATSVLLLIACANVANLLLARGAGRRREIAVRAALGASRGRILRQLMIESVLLALAAAIVALPIAWYGIRWMRDAVPVTDPMVPSYMQWSMDARTFAYAIVVALLTGLVFGLAPALDATGRRLQNPLREGTGAAGSRVQQRTHRILIVAQMALALGLLATASLFVRTYVGLSRVPLGYDTSHLMTMRVYFTGPRYDKVPERERAIDDIAARLATLPGARAATVSDLVPLDDQGGSDAPAEIEGQTFDEGKAPTLHYAGVAGRWPETFDMRVLDGRTFLEPELQAKAPVALVNAKLAATFWPGQNPLRRRFRIADDESFPWMTVIGVVPDIRTVKLDESGQTPPTAYVPHRFLATRNYGIIVRTEAAPESVVAGVRDLVRAVDPSLPLFDVYSMEQVRWLSYWMYVLWGTLFGVFGLVALAIAAIGVYGVVYYTVARRTREIGLRVALGASRTQVVGPMLRQSAWLAGGGILIGLATASFITPVVGSLLIGVSPNDPTGLAGVSLTLLAIVLVATWVPAWRASRVDPMVALRDE